MRNSQEFKDKTEIYDIVEFLIENSKNSDILKEKFNEVFIKENSAYRIVNSMVVPIVEDIELECLDETLNIEFDVVKNQIKNALILLKHFLLLLLCFLLFWGLPNSFTVLRHIYTPKRAKIKLRMSYT